MARATKLQEGQYLTAAARVARRCGVLGFLGFSTWAFAAQVFVAVNFRAVRLWDFKFVSGSWGFLVFSEFDGCMGFGLGASGVVGFRGFRVYGVLASQAFGYRTSWG